MALHIQPLAGDRDDPQEDGLELPRQREDVPHGAALACRALQGRAGQCPQGGRGLVSRS